MFIFDIILVSLFVGSVTMISLAAGPENTMSELANHHLSTSLQSTSENKENIEQHSSSSTSSGSFFSTIENVECDYKGHVFTTYNAYHFAGKRHPCMASVTSEF